MRGREAAAGLFATTIFFSAIAQGDPPKTRVAIMGFRAEGSSAEGVAAPRDEIAKQVAETPGFEVVTEDDVKQAMTSQHAKEQSICVQNVACLGRVAKALKVPLVITGTLAPSGGKHLLTLSAIDVEHPATPSTTTESMKQLKNFASNVTLCLKRILAPPAVAGTTP